MIRIGLYEYDCKNLLSIKKNKKIYRGNHIDKKEFTVIIQQIFYDHSNSLNLLNKLFIYKTINSKYILRLYDFKVDFKSSYYFLVKEYCKKQNLLTYLNYMKINLNEKEKIILILKMFRKLMKGMKILYHLNIIHNNLTIQHIYAYDNQLKISFFGKSFIVSNLENEFNFIDTISICKILRTMFIDIKNPPKIVIDFCSKGENNLLNWKSLFDNELISKKYKFSKNSIKNNNVFILLVLFIFLLFIRILFFFSLEN